MLRSGRRTPKLMSDFASIADLPVNDDLDVPLNANDYQDQTGPAPAKPGIYRLTVVKAEPRKKDGQIVLAEGKFPTLVLQQVKIVEPVENERGVGVFTDVRFKPFTRKGPGQRDVVASDLFDLLRGFDDSANISGIEEAKQLLQQHLEQGSSFLAQIGWTGYDKDYVDQEFAKIGAADRSQRSSVAKDIANAIYAKARLNTKNFTINGELVSSVTGPSGNTVEAQPKITRYYPSSTEIGKGKDERNRDRVVLGPFASAKKAA